MAADISVRVGIDGAAEFKRTLGNINAALKTNAAELKKVGVEFEDSGDKSGQMAAEIEVLEKRLELLRQKEAAERQELERLSQKYGENSTQVERHRKYLTETETEIIKLNKQLPKMREQMELGAESVEEMTDGLEGSTKAAGELGTVLSGAAVLAAVRQVGELFSAGAKSAIEFESAMTGVYKTVDGTDEQLADIREGIRDLAVEIPASTSELAAVAESAGQLGIATDDILSFTKTMTMLGTTTNMSAETAATALARFANVAGTAPENYERLGSTIVALGNNFAATESEITEMAQRLASAGSLAGLNEADIMALAAAMSSVGIEAEAGGTAMTQTLNAISKAVDTQSNKLGTLAAIAGMSAQQFSAAWRAEPIEALTAFIGGLGELDEQGESSTLILDELGMSGVRQSNMLRSLSLASEEMTGAVELANTAWEENTALQDEANLRYDTTESKLQLLHNSVERLSTAYGETLTPAIGLAADGTANLVNKLAGVVEQCPGVGTAITSLGAGLTTFGVGTVVTTALQCERLATAIKAIGIAAKSNPYIAIAAAVATLGTGLVSLIADLDNMGEEYTDLATVQEELIDLQNRQNERIREGLEPSESLAAKIKLLEEREQQLLGTNKSVNEQLAQLPVVLDKSKEAEQSGANTMRGYAIGLDGERDRVYAKTAEIAQGALDTWNGTLDIHSPSREFEKSAEYSVEGYINGWDGKSADLYATLRGIGEKSIAEFNEGAAAAASASMADVQSQMAAAWKNAQISYGNGTIKFGDLEKALKNTYTVGLIDEEMYYKKLAALRDKYLTEGDSDWQSIGLDIYKYEQEKLKNLTKEYEEEVQEMQEQTEDALSDIKDRWDDVAAARDKMSDKLSGYGELYSTVKLNFSDGSSEEQYRLADWEKQIEVLQEYRDTLDSLKSRNIADGLLDEVLGMSIDEAVRYGRELLAQTDEDWEKYNGGWAQKQRLAAEIADEYYAEKLNNLEGEYAEQLRVGLAEGYELKINDYLAMLESAVPSDLAVNYSTDTAHQRDGNMLEAVGEMFGAMFGGAEAAGDMTVVFKIGDLEFARALLPSFRQAAAENPVAEVDF